MVFVASNKDEYYGVNVTTGEIVWTFVTARGTEDAGGYLVGSMSYNDGRLFVVDMFFITALNATNGEVIWKSWQGTELYTSPTYADGKVYVATDRRLIYVLNASDGKRLSHFEPTSNCWSSPTVYEGSMYIGNNNWNVYCFSEYQVIKGQISAILDQTEIRHSEHITGTGQIDPMIAYVPVTLYFTKPDGSADKVQVRANNDGTFGFDYSPDDVGEYAVTITCSGSSYLMQSAELGFKVMQEPSEPEQTPPESEEPTNDQQSGLPTEQIVAVILLFVVLVIVVVAFLFLRKRNRSSHVVIR
jgi:hypothetical protein